MMKFIIQVIIYILIAFGSLGQSTETKTYFFGEPYFWSRLTPEAKSIISKIIQEQKVDTLKWYRVSSEEAFTKYTNGKYLIEHSHKVFNWINCDGAKPFFQMIDRTNAQQKPLSRILILYTTSTNGNCQNLVAYLLN